jgi:hypothetical protein
VGIKQLNIKQLEEVILRQYTSKIIIFRNLGMLSQKRKETLVKSRNIGYPGLVAAAGSTEKYLINCCFK